MAWRASTKGEPGVAVGVRLGRVVAVNRIVGVKLAKLVSVGVIVVLSMGKEVGLGKLLLGVVSRVRNGVVIAVG